MKRNVQIYFRFSTYDNSYSLLYLIIWQCAHAEEWAGCEAIMAPTKPAIGETHTVVSQNSPV